LECLKSIIESTAEIECELIVVDNASADGSLEAVRNAYPLAITISNATNLGFGAACNQGIKLTTADFILLLNSDARINAPALHQLLTVMRLNQPCGAVGCTVVDENGNPTVSVRNFLTPFNHALEELGLTKKLNISYLRRTFPSNVAAAQAESSVDWIEGSCLLLRRAALEQVGLFDERFFMYSEDEDLCFRLKQQGWLICFTNSSRIIHQGGASASQNSREMLKHFYLSQMLFLEKHRGRSSVILYYWVCRTSLWLKQISRSIRRRDYDKANPSARLAAISEACRDWRLAENRSVPDQELSKTGD
jgi:GT2 family glycosyltransferase